MGMVSKIKEGGIVPGRGYSSDSQQIASQICYNVTAGPVSGQMSYIKLDSAMSFLDFQRELHVDVTAKAKFWIFSGDAEASYMRSVQNKDASMSLNYYQYAAGEISISLLGYGKEALNKFGESAYQNGTNPYFGLLCGDNIIDSYQEGALLALGINIQFRSSSDKEQFKAITGGSFADIFSASVQIQKVINQSKIIGLLSMQAFQVGGDPSQLAHILAKDPSGNYYATSCSLSAMDQCIKAANGLLDYAKNNFPTQFSFQNGKGLTALGVGFIGYVPIEFIGLHSTSLVTPQILEERQELAEALQENQYYQQKFNELVNGYIVPWDTASKIYKSYVGLLQQASINVNALMDTDPKEGPIGCYNYPDKCDSIYKRIMSELNPITPSDLGVLDAIKYTIGFSVFYVCRNGDTPSSWGVVVLPPNERGEHLRSVDFVSITDNSLDVKDTYYSGKTGHIWCAHCKGTSSDGGVYYSGTITNGRNVCKYVNHGIGWNTLESSYYFEAYKGDNDGTGYGDGASGGFNYDDRSLEPQVNASYDDYYYEGV